MIQVLLHESVLRLSTSRTLARNQASVDAKTNWTEKVGWAAKKWKRKPKSALADVQAHLIGASASLNLCSYCEFDRAAQVEHVFNKKLYPEWTFVFTNYLMVCPLCNNRKQDDFAVFHDTVGTNVTRYEKGGPSIRPLNANNVFINPRHENPMDFFWLDLKTGELKIHPLADERQRIQSLYTLHLLELNEDRTLREHRRLATFDYLRDLQAYIACRESKNLNELASHLPSEQLPIGTNTSLDDAKAIGMAICLEIMHKRHFPTIWLEMKRQYKLNPMVFAHLYPSIAQALDAVPELLQ